MVVKVVNRKVEGATEFTWRAIGIALFQSESAVHVKTYISPVVVGHTIVVST